MNHPLGLTWTGRMKVSKGAYFAVKCPDHPRAWKNGYIYEHRIIAECMIGRLLTPAEEVHHKNENSLDNTPTNLEVLTGGNHRKHHGSGITMITLTCVQCDRPFTKPKNKVVKNERTPDKGEVVGSSPTEGTR